MKPKFHTKQYFTLQQNREHIIFTFSLTRGDTLHKTTMSQWDYDVPFEIEVKTNWAEELLGLEVSDQCSRRDRKRNRPSDNEGRDGKEEDKREEKEDKEEEEEEEWPMNRDDVLPGKDVFLLTPCFTSEECVKIIAASEALGFGRTNYPKKYR
jgi:hypothetical protein